MLAQLIVPAITHSRNALTVIKNIYSGMYTRTRTPSSFTSKHAPPLIALYVGNPFFMANGREILASCNSIALIQDNLTKKHAVSFIISNFHVLHLRESIFPV